jgi:glyoxylase-like metal-dependent hydrolase (beta-lactamase superfamily II)
VARSLGVPIAVVVNTHWHLDHVSGNPMLRRTFPSLTVLGSVAIDEALKGFLARYRSQLLQLSGESVDPVDRAVYLEEVARIDAGRALAPDVAVEESRTRSLAGRPMLVAVTRPAVTAADVWVFDPSSGVLAAGDLVTLPVPLLDTACVAGWQSAMASLVDVPFLLLVPGHGRPMTRDGFETYRRGLDHLVECAASDRPEQSCIEGWLDDLGSLVPEGERGFARALLGHYVPNVLRAPPDRSAGPCGKAPADRSGVAP